MWRVRNPYDLSRRSYGVHEFATIHDGATTMLLRQRHDKPLDSRTVVVVNGDESG